MCINDLFSFCTIALGSDVAQDGTNQIQPVPARSLLVEAFSNGFAGIHVEGKRPNRRSGSCKAPAIMVVKAGISQNGLVVVRPHRSTVRQAGFTASITSATPASDCR
jgi:hypothetical protein